MSVPYPAGKRAAVAWTLTEAANEPFFTLVQRYVFSVYFVTHLAVGADGASLWGYMQAAAGLMVAVLAPVLGSVADAGGRRKPWVIALGLIAGCACASLWWVQPGTSIAVAVVAVLASSVAVEVMLVFTNAYLPQVARPDRTGVLSGLTLAFGQLAGIAALGCIIMLSDNLPAHLKGIPFAVDRLSGPLSALAIVLFLTPLLLFVPDNMRQAMTARKAVHAGVGVLRATLRSAIASPNMRRFLIGRAIGTDGLTLVFAFGGVLAAQNFGWNTGTLASFGMLVTIVSAASGFFGAWLDSHFGGRWTICTGMVLVAIGTTGLLLCDATRAWGVPTGIGLSAPFASPQEQGFVVAAFLIAIGAGPAIASMRGMMSRIAPLDRMTGYFGLYALVGKATNFIGPLAVGWIRRQLVRFAGRWSSHYCSSRLVSSSLLGLPKRAKVRPINQVNPLRAFDTGRVVVAGAVAFAQFGDCGGAAFGWQIGSPGAECSRWSRAIALTCHRLADVWAI